MKKLAEILDFLANEDWLKPSPTTIAAAAVASGAVGWFLASPSSWAPLWAVLMGSGLCFLIVPRVLAFANMGRDAAESERQALEAKREAFYALAPEITKLVLLAESRLDSFLHNEGEPRAEALHLIMRLRGEFGIDLPEEPSLFVIGRFYVYLREIGELAYAKNLKEAQKLKAPS